MDFDFGVIAPEINSARMYSGPGSGPLMAAARAWEQLAADLNSTANSYSAVLASLTNDEWLGPASAHAAASAAPYVAWVRITAGQADQAATQAAAAASAYETALAMTVPPAVIEANRDQAMSLIRTNTLGQNTAAIAANEAQYGEMWAQDVAAMEAYASSSTAAATLTPFTSPPAAANPAAAASSAAATDIFGTGYGLYFAFIAAGVIGDAITNAIAFGASLTNSVIGNGLAETQMLNSSHGSAAQGAADTTGTVLASNITPATSAATATGRSGITAAAGMGRAIPVSGLSTPPAWAIPPAIRKLVTALPYTSAGAAPLVAPDESDNSYAAMALAGALGSSLAGIAVRDNSAPHSTTPNPAAAKPAAARMPAMPAIPIATPAAGLPPGVAESLAATLAAIPGATIVVIPPAPTAQ